MPQTQGSVEEVSAAAVFPTKRIAVGSKLRQIKAFN